MMFLLSHWTQVISFLAGAASLHYGSKILPRAKAEEATIAQDIKNKLP